MSCSDRIKLYAGMMYDFHGCDPVIEKRKIKMKILLFGVSNVGKTTVGRALAEEMGYLFFDLDEVIEEKYGSITAFQSEY
ncbi:MAG: shikimate kinase [Bulleidia sp.]